MELYTSDFLSIHKKGDTLVQRWSDKTLTHEKFTEELQHFLGVANQELPKSVVWLHENFTLNIPPDLYNWIENTITVQQYKRGIRKIAFTVAPEVRAHISVINSFSQVQSVFNPIFFGNETDALQFAASKDIADNMMDSNLSYGIQVNETSKRAHLQMEMHLDDMSEVISTMSSIQSKQKLITAEHRRFLSLTEREKEVMRNIALGRTNKEISEVMCISIHTVKNHRKQILQKLNISSIIDIYRYALAFKLIHF